MSGHRFFSAGIAGATSSKPAILADSDADGGRHHGCRSQADAAALFYWQDSDPSYYRPAPMAQPRKPKARRPSAKTEAAIKETNAKPQGPLIIAVSIDQQKVRVYDANGLFAESPVSTGMKGHSTPMGVFSVIQKNKMHRSNIYSGAPMPYMQRITWSGVAMHAGVLPGYPASHGCIRMPMAFAVKMWNWTRMGARVIVTPGADHARQLLASVAGGAEGRAAAPHRQRSGDRRARGEERQGRGRRPCDQACECQVLRIRRRASISDRPSATRRRCANRPTPRMPAAPLPAINAVVTMSDATPSAAKVQPASDAPNAEAKAGRDAIRAGGRIRGRRRAMRTDVTPASRVCDGSSRQAEAEQSEAKSDAVNVEAPTAAITRRVARTEAPKIEEAKAR
mgnify:CR=1 FL=1